MSVRNLNSGARDRVALIFGLALGAFVCMPVFAGEYTARVRVDQEFSHNDNVQLRSDVDENVTNYELEPGLSIDGKGERWSIDSNIRLAFDRYSDDNFDSDNQRADFTLERWGERNRWSLSSQLDRNSTLRSEEFTTGIFDATRKTTIRVTPTWLRQLGAADQISSSLSFSKVQYDSAGLFDYEYGAFDTSWTHTLNERTSFTTRAFVNRFDSETRALITDPEPVRESLTYGVEFGFFRIFTERVSGRLSAGLREVESTTPIDQCVSFFGPFCLEFGPGEIKFKDSGSVVTGSLDYKGERLTLGFTASQNVQPSGNGLLLNRIEGKFSAEWQFTEDLRGSISTHYMDNESTETQVDLSPLFARRFFVANSSMRWRISEKWWLGGGVRYRNQEFIDSGGGHGESLIYFLSIDYRRPAFAL